MKLTCKVYEDLLPMYHDGVCSEDSKALVEEHLKECESCSAMLADLRGEIALPQTAPEDLKPLEEIKTKWDETKRRAVKKGVCVTLAVVAVILAVWTCVWYFGYARAYDVLGSKLEKVTDHEAAMTTADYQSVVGDYKFTVKRPGFLGNSGFVSVCHKVGAVVYLDENRDPHLNQDPFFYVFFYPQWGGGYKVALTFDSIGETEWIWLNGDLIVNDAGVYCEPLAQTQQVIDDHYDEILAVFDAIYDLWGIRLIEG
ncbi:MAG: zf-HC2 domain-containing protein [Oscillospiraceae bacterium]|nr:zf-HC2 domain-containing protein [Oscillospiraceae bacterium]